LPIVPIRPRALFGSFLARYNHSASCANCARCSCVGRNIRCARCANCANSAPCNRLARCARYVRCANCANSVCCRRFGRCVRCAACAGCANSARWGRVARSLGRSLGRSIARSLGRSLGRSIARSSLRPPRPLPLLSSLPNSKNRLQDFTIPQSIDCSIQVSTILPRTSERSINLSYRRMLTRAPELN
jgi:hypothetical protein